jgi:predicted ATPase with chaperone activity
VALAVDVAVGQETAKLALAVDAAVGQETAKLALAVGQPGSGRTASGRP